MFELENNRSPSTIKSPAKMPLGHRAGDCHNYLEHGAVKGAF